jgi:hypothetical protein
MRFLVSLVVLLAACAAPPTSTGWQGPDVHLVDGKWIGKETPCSSAAEDLECRIVVEQALSLVPGIRDNVTKAARASLPTTFVMSNGEVRTGHFGGGLNSGEVVVLDLRDGTRRIVALTCYLPSQDGHLVLSMVECRPDGLEDWRDGAVPRYPEGTKFA